MTPRTNLFVVGLPVLGVDAPAGRRRRRPLGRNGLPGVIAWVGLLIAAGMVAADAPELAAPTATPAAEQEHESMEPLVLRWPDDSSTDSDAESSAELVWPFEPAGDTVLRCLDPAGGRVLWSRPIEAADEPAGATIRLSRAEVQGLPSVTLAGRRVAVGSLQRLRVPDSTLPAWFTTLPLLPEMLTITGQRPLIVVTADSAKSEKLVNRESTGVWVRWRGQRSVVAHPAKIENSLLSPSTPARWAAAGLEALNLPVPGANHSHATIDGSIDPAAGWLAMLRAASEIDAVLPSIGGRWVLDPSASASQTGLASALEIPPVATLLAGRRRSSLPPPRVVDWPPTALPAPETTAADRPLRLPRINDLLLEEFADDPVPWIVDDRELTSPRLLQTLRLRRLKSSWSGYSSHPITSTDPRQRYVVGRCWTPPPQPGAAAANRENFIWLVNSAPWAVNVVVSINAADRLEKPEFSGDGTDPAVRWERAASQPTPGGIQLTLGPHESLLARWKPVSEPGKTTQPGKATQPGEAAESLTLTATPQDAGVVAVKLTQQVTAVVERLGLLAPSLCVSASNPAGASDPSALITAAVDAKPPIDAAAVQTAKLPPDDSADHQKVATSGSPNALAAGSSIGAHRGRDNCHLQNADFEQVGPLGIVRWVHAHHPAGAVEVDDRVAHRGTRSIRLAAATGGSTAWIMSPPLPSPTTGRLALTLAVRSAPRVDSVPRDGAADASGERAPAPVGRARVAIEWVEANHGHRAGQVLAVPADGAWHGDLVRLEATELPTAGSAEVRVTIDNVGNAPIWIDDVMLTDWFATAAERDAMQRLAFMAVRGLQKDDWTPAARLLTQPWTEELLALAPTTDATLTPPPASAPASGRAAGLVKAAAGVWPTITRTATLPPRPAGSPWDRPVNPTATNPTSTSPPPDSPSPSTWKSWLPRPLRF